MHHRAGEEEDGQDGHSDSFAPKEAKKQRIEAPGEPPGDEAQEDKFSQKHRKRSHAFSLKIFLWSVNDVWMRKITHKCAIAQKCVLVSETSSMWGTGTLFTGSFLFSFEFTFQVLHPPQ